jgi:hypothetical protein
MRELIRLSLVATMLSLAPAALAQSDPAGSNALALGNSEIYARSFAALTMLFVIAVLLESAFATIFNWRVFLTYFSLRGVRTLIMVAISLVVVNLFDVDILANIIAAYKLTPNPDAGASALAFERAVAATSGPISLFVTALILAGGSAGVYNVLSALGYRNEKREEEIFPKPPKDKAWVAIRVTRVDSVGQILVKVAERKPGEAGVPADIPAPIAGTIYARRPSLRELLLRNTNRFPQNGGYTVTQYKIYSISVEGKDKDGTMIRKLDDQLFVFAPGAIVDLDVAL